MSAEILKSPDDWARHFKLHSCIGNKKFAKQIMEIRDNALRVGYNNGLIDGQEKYRENIIGNLR